MKSARLALGLLASFVCVVSVSAQAPGPVQTLDGSGAARPVFSSKDDVFLAAGAFPSDPCTAAGSLSDGIYYFQVTDATGRSLLSTDTVERRAFRVRNGRIDSTYVNSPFPEPLPADFLAPVQTHEVGPTSACGSSSIELAPFLDAGPGQAAYLVWITPESRFAGATDAVDNDCGEGCFHGFQPEFSRMSAFRVEDKRNCQATFCVSGVKYADVNGNGVRDAGEPGLAGVEIRADNGTGPVLSGLTGADGTFRICGLLEGGSYRISEVAPFGYVQTGPLDHRVSRRVIARGLAYLVSLCDADVAGLDFGNQLIPNAVGGVKFEDLNANGVQDAGEPPMAGVTISLFPGTPAAPGVSRTAVTDANGHFLFTSVAPGPFFLVEAVPSGFTQTTPASGVITGTLVSGSSSIANVFGNFRGALTGSISGTKFLDVNGNGVRDPGEAGQAGVTFTISGPAGFAPRTAVSAADGAFTFTGVPFGTYTVTETVPLGFRQTAPAAPGTVSAALSVSQRAVTGLLFGNQALAAPATISGTKFIDTNGNGLRDPGEPGGAGVVIRLQGSTGTPILATTAADGSFSFAGLAPGTYTISEIVPVGFTQTAPGGAGTFSVTVAAGDVRSDLLFGNRPSGALAPGSVSGTKMLDLNQNGIVDGIDRPLEGITFVLTAPDGTTRQTVSGADGIFRFDNVPPGSYVLSEILPANFFQTFPGTPAAPRTYNVTVQSGQNAAGFLFLNKC